MTKKRQVKLKCGHIIDNVHAAIFYKGESHYCYTCRSRQDIVDRQEIEEEDEHVQTDLTSTFFSGSI